MFHGVVRRVAPFCFFVLLAIAQSWPLPRHLGTHLTGSPTGDTGVYVWNTWVFRHELVDHHQSPYRTSTIFSLDPPTDLSLHNYTPFADLLALVVQPFAGVVASFNLIYLLNVALAGLGMYVLVRQVTGRAAEAWLAGALFACSPFLVARGTSHFSLASAAPIPFFLWRWLHFWDARTLRNGLLVGVMVAWAALCDPYYAIYCVMLGGAFMASRAWRVERRDPPARERRWLKRVVEAAIAMAGLLVLAVIALGGAEVRLWGTVLAMHTLYTPVLVLTLLVCARLLLAWRPRLVWQSVPDFPALIRGGAAAVATTTVLLLPLVTALVERILSGRFTAPPVGWRSSAPGVDALALLLPNPMHPLMPQAIPDWLATQPGGFVEQVASLPLVAIAIVAIAWRRTGFRPTGWWLGVTIAFTWLSLGPFLRVAGVTTCVPTPWTVLRYAPLIGEARMPSRFAVVAVAGLSVLFAGALASLTSRFARRRRLILAGVGVALAAELLPVPRPLYSARVPDVYRVVADDPRPITVLDLPVGVRDGLSSLGNFSAASEYFQTLHGKPLIGGYLSRVSEPTKAVYRSLPVVAALMTLSENRPLDPADAASARAGAGAFLSRARVGYVVIDTTRASPDLQRFAIDVFGLRKVGDAAGHELYVPSADGARRAGDATPR